MDPWLEGPEFSGFHGPLIVEIGRQLAPRLRPRYVARMQSGFAVDSADGEEAVGVEERAEVYQDVAVVKESGTIPGSAAKTAVLSAPLELHTVMPKRVPQHSLAIRDVAGRQLVAVIEVLSPSNKRGDGFEQYLERRTRFLRSSAHLMEIDLLRRGRRPPMREKLPATPYFVFLSRAGRRPVTQVWPVPLRTALPEVPVPLLAGDAEVMLNLQQALTNVYDSLAYDISTDYDSLPTVALGKEDAEWASKRVKEWRDARQTE